MVTRLSEDANNMLIHLPDFSAPSKYGNNAALERSDEMVIDVFRRETPKLPASYDVPPFHPMLEQQALVDAVIAIVAVTNHVLNQEAIALGKSVGLEREAIEKMIIWSVGTNWVLENQARYTPKRKSDPRVPDLRLPLIDAALKVIKA